MGNTTRREPINSKIPSSPDYKFLNITNFKGIYKSDNPFLVDSTTASDALNVYVDENNALTTRPRLEKRYSLFDSVDDFKEMLYAYKLLNGMLFQIKKIDDTVALIRERDGVFYDIALNDHTISDDRCGVIEQNENIYITNSDYFVIKNDDCLYPVINDSDTYVPTTQIKYLTQKDVPAVEFEESNILTNKYKIEYYWDLNSELSQEIGKGTILKNNYFKSYVSDTITHSWDDRLTQTLMPITHDIFAIRNDKTDNAPENLDIYELDDENKIVLKHHIVQDNIFNINPSCNTYMYYTKTEGFTWPTGLVVCDMDTGEEYTLTLPNGYEPPYYPSKRNSLISDDGKHIFVSVRHDSKDHIYQYDYDGDTESYIGKSVATDVKSDFFISSDFQKIISYDMSDGTLLLLSDFSTDVPIREEMSYADLVHGVLIGFSSDASKIYVLRGGIEVNEASITGAPQLQSKVHYLSHTPVVDQNGPIVLSVEEDAVYYRVSENSRVSIRKYFFDTAKDIELYSLVLPENTYHPDFYAYVLSNDGGVFFVLRERTYSDNITLNIQRLEPSDKPELLVEYTSEDNIERMDNKKLIRYQNQTWLYGNGNKVFWSGLNDVTYFPKSNYTSVGSDDDVIDALVPDTTSMVLFKKDRFYLVTQVEINEAYTYAFLESKSTNGAVAPMSAIISPLQELPLYVGAKGIYALQQTADVQSSDQVSKLVSLAIEPIYNEAPNKNKIFSTSNLYWTYFICPKNNISDAFVFDDRTSSWYKWEFPCLLVSAWYDNEKTFLADQNGNIYTLETKDIILENNTYYHDDGDKLIEWRWVSQILPMGTINYAKKLNTTTFIMTDTDETDDYCLDYKFKVFRKVANESNPTTISSSLNYIRSVTKKTIISRFNFLQLELSNSPKSEEYSANNKLRLIGIGFKYELLAGLM